MAFVLTSSLTLYTKRARALVVEIPTVFQVSIRFSVSDATLPNLTLHLFPQLPHNLRSLVQTRLALSGLSASLAKQPYPFLLCEAPAPTPTVL